MSTSIYVMFALTLLCTCMYHGSYAVWYVTNRTVYITRDKCKSKCSPTFVWGHNTSHLPGNPHF